MCLFNYGPVSNLKRFKFSSSATRMFFYKCFYENFSAIRALNKFNLCCNRKGNCSCSIYKFFLQLGLGHPINIFHSRGFLFIFSLRVLPEVNKVSVVFIVAKSGI